MKKKTEQTETAPLSEQITEAVAVVAALEEEKARMPADIRAAGDAADAVQIVALQRRFDELPAHITAAKIRLQRLRVIEHEAAIEEAKEEARRLAESITPAQAKFDEARRELERANSEHADAYEHQRSLQLDLGAMRRRLEELQRENMPTLAPVVRSAWQGQAA